MSNTNCLINSIGISHPKLCPSECLPTIESNDSISGLYLNGYDDGSIKIEDLFCAFDCPPEKFEEGLFVMLEAATTEFLMSYNAMLTSQKHSIYNSFNTSIGDYQKSDGPWVDSRKYAVARLRAKDCIRGQVLCIRELKLWMIGTTQDTNFTVEIYSDRDLSTPIDSVVITANPSGSINKNINLPLSDSSGSITYYFVYDRQNFSPRNTLWNCACGGGSRPWEAYISVGGCFVDNILDLQGLSCNEEYSAGLSINATIKCDPLAFICSLDFSCGYGQYVARAIQLIFRRMAAEYIANCSVLAAAPMVKNNAQRIPWYNENIEWVLQYLVQEYQSSFSDCFLCSENGPEQEVISHLV